MTDAPDFTLPHVGGPEISLRDFRDKPVVLVFGGRATKDQARAIGHTIGVSARGRANLISILHMAGIPKLARPVAKREVRKAWEEAVVEATADGQARGEEQLDPHRLIVLLLDWDGSVAESYDVGNPNDEAKTVVIVDGQIAHRSSGVEAGTEVVSFLAGR